MHVCRSNYAFAILFGAVLMVSMMSGSAEVSIFNCSQDLPGSLLKEREFTSNSTELDSSNPIDNQSIDTAMLKLPLSFIENRGQSPEDVKFMVRIEGPMVLFTPSEVVFSLSCGNNSSAVHMAFENSSPGEIIGEEQLPGRANFFLGNDTSQWISDIPTFGAIRYKELYPGVDLVFKGTEGYLKHELALEPGANLSRIVLTYSGQDNLSLAEDGSLLIETSAGNLTDSVPICYQEINGSREIVEGRYRLFGDNGVGFEIGDYDRRYPLVIDPALATYLGGSGDDSGLSLAIDSSGNAYVAGYTASTNFPTNNPLQSSNAGSSDVFVAKINSAGSALSYSTYLGGGGNDYAKGIAVDGSGNAYVTGYTASTNFPIKNPLQSSNAGSNDAFIAKINSAGSALTYSTYLGGSSNDYGEGIAVDSSGNAYITGYTDSTSFPTKNPIQASKAGLWDAFVSKINSAGSALTYSTYLGGSSYEYGLGIAIDSSGNAYITGPTYSTNFPIMNPLQASNGGEMDAFVSKINSAGSALTYSTYLGGSFNDFAEGIAVDRNGNSYVTGYTISNDFPTKNPIQALKNGPFDAFVTKINSAGSALDYSTFLGGSGDCFAHGIAVDAGGNAIVTGDTSSADFPTKNPVQSSNSGSYDVFVTLIDPTGSALSFSTYLGGVYHDYAKGIAIDDSYNAYLTGYTESDNFPSQNPLQAANAGYKDAFVAFISCSNPIPIDLPTVTNGIGATLVTTNTARLNGEITGTGGQNPSVIIYWGTSDGGTNIGHWTQQLSLGNLGKQTFSRDISGLNPGTKYYYRCYASNSAGASWASSTETFTTDTKASNPFIIIDSQGRTHIFARGGDNALWLNLDGTWLSLGGVITSDPFAIKDSQGVIHVLVRGADNDLWDRTVDGGWTYLGGAISSNPSAALSSDNHIKVAVKGADSALWMKDITTGSWTALGGVITSDPFAIKDSQGVIHVLVRGADNDLWDRTVDGGWTYLGGAISSNPSAALSSDNHIKVAVKGADSALWMKDITTGSWTALGGVITSDPFAIKDSQGVIHVLVRGADNDLWDRTVDGGWTYLGGIISSNPSAALSSDNHIKVAVKGTDSALWMKDITTGSWTALGGVLTSNPQTILNSSSMMHVMARGSDDSL